MLTVLKGMAGTGPLVLLFSNLTMLMLETPSTQHFTLMGVRLTDKVGSQALLCASHYSTCIHIHDLAKSPL